MVVSEWSRFMIKVFIFPEDNEGTKITHLLSDYMLGL